MRIRTEGLAIIALAVLTGAACSKAEQGASAPQQILRFPVFQDPKSWDPAEASSEAETSSHRTCSTTCGASTTV